MATVTAVKKRCSTPHSSPMRTGGSSCWAAGRRQKWAKNIPPSQTMEAMACTQDKTQLPVLQPLIGMDKRDIVKIAREIGTFDTSILPYEDCCTVFTPRHPKTRPTVAEVAEAESALDIDALVHEAVDGIERIRIDL